MDLNSTPAHSVLIWVRERGWILEERKRKKGESIWREKENKEKVHSSIVDLAEDVLRDKMPRR